MNSVEIRKIGVSKDEDVRALLSREWLLTNGLGGYASGTLGGPVSRRYHGLLIAALPAPLGRTVMLNQVSEFLRLPDGRVVGLGEDISGYLGHLTEFRLEYQLPVWRYEFEGIVVEKSALLVHGQNTVHLTYELISGPDGIRIELHPAVQFRPHEADVDSSNLDYTISVRGRRYEISAGEYYPSLRLAFSGERPRFIHSGGEVREVTYAKEAERGYHARGLLWNPGFFFCPLHAHAKTSLVASTEPWSTIDAFAPANAREIELERCRHLVSIVDSEADAETTTLVMAADQFLIIPAGRVVDGARARAQGDDVRTVIAGYHWFTDWGRDTMISLEGLTLATGRHDEAGWILRTFAHYVRDGLIPNMFPEGEAQGLYHTADATLWFFHALDRYVEVTGDERTLEVIFPKLRDIIRHHEAGTKFHIGVDPADGLLRQGQDGYQLTWMDAKVDGWVVTPRRGKAVEINALWYNALCLMEKWLRQRGETAEADTLGARAAQARESFNRRFWNESTGFLYDVVDGEHGDDPACRPNQIFSISLPHPVLDESRWNDVLTVVQTQLLTPFGLRSLSRDHPDYKARYFGDLRARDAAYHQGTVWGWLIGPYIDAWLKVHPENREEIHSLLRGLVAHFNDACIGTMSEVFDAEAPFTPRGCIAQAWSVAEVLRCWLKTTKLRDHLESARS